MFSRCFVWSVFGIHVKEGGIPWLMIFTMSHGHDCRRLHKWHHGSCGFAITIAVTLYLPHFEHTVSLFIVTNLGCRRIHTCPMFTLHTTMAGLRLHLPRSVQTDKCENYSTSIRYRNNSLQYFAMVNVLHVVNSASLPLICLKKVRKLGQLIIHSEVFVAFYCYMEVFLLHNCS